jgi:hypothetical protein
MLELILTALILLAAFLSIGCASRRPLPERPRIPVCIANDEGGAMCWDGVNLEPKNVVNFICFDPRDHEREQVWIRDLIEATNGI